MTLWMFVLRLSYSGKAVHVAYANQAQESFFDGLVTAFGVLDGVPARLSYENVPRNIFRVMCPRELCGRLGGMRCTAGFVGTRRRRPATYHSE